MSDELYKQHILDLYNKPHNKEEMDDADLVFPAKNISCGDSYILYLKTSDTHIERATFSGVGCAVSQAAASLLTDKVRGMTFSEAKKITEKDVFAMLGIEITIGRQKCALILYNALQQALKNYE
jgi:nitrogen fixation NifU-like protein